MRAIACTKYGPPDVLRLVDRPKPVAREDEVLIKTGEIKAVGAKTTRFKVGNRRHLVSIDDSALVLDSKRLGRVRELVESGAVNLINDKIHPLEQMAEAHIYVELGNKKGNVAITVARTV